MMRKCVAAALGCLLVVLVACQGKQQPQEAGQTYVSSAPAFSPDSAMAYVAAQTAFGPRVPASAAHDSCGAWIAGKFRSLGAEVMVQSTEVSLYDGRRVPCVNIIASYNPQATKRLLLCSHWDSRPWADNDPDSACHHTPIDGANDGASGVAVLLELARQLQLRPAQVGVDLICFDVEDCGTPQWEEDDRLHQDKHWCLGSQYWAAHPHAEGYTASFGILLDMVGGAGCEFRLEGFSQRMAPRVVDKVWSAAQRIGRGDYFVYTAGHYVTDDHLSVNQRGIPCIDVIASDKDSGDFPSTWHTLSDDLAHIDPGTLSAVGQTVVEVVYTETP